MVAGALLPLLKLKEEGEQISVKIKIILNLPFVTMGSTESAQQRKKKLYFRWGGNFFFKDESKHYESFVCVFFSEQKLSVLFAAKKNKKKGWAAKIEKLK